MILKKVPSVYIECKRLKTLGPIGRAWRKSEENAKGNTIVLHIKEDHGEHLVVVSLGTWNRLMGVLGSDVKVVNAMMSKEIQDEQG